MAKYSVKAYADWDRRLKEQHKIIEANDDEEAWILAWKTFPEYKELQVCELKEGHNGRKEKILLAQAETRLF